jgi:hypothetical protein
MRSRNVLFADGDLGAALRANLDRVSPAVDKIPKDQFLATPEADLIDHIFGELGGEPLAIFEDRMESSERETRVDVSGDPSRFFREDHSGPAYVPGHEITIEIPFTGEELLWKLRPSSWKSVVPHGDITPCRGDLPGTLLLRFSSPIDSLDEESLGKQIEQELQLIRFYVETSASEVEGHNVQLRAAIERSISARKDRIEKTEGLASRLGLRTKRNPNAPDVNPIKVTRKLVRPLPPVQSGSYEPEYGIEDETCEHILAVIRHEIATFEVTPATYSSLGEEDLRNILLAHLNGHYEGDATGETFRKSGKTDIRIEAESRAAFIAECKLWSGPKGLSDAVDQLLGYLTWRDCKAALVIFNKENKGFVSILDKCPLQLESHPNFKRAITPRSHPAEWRACFQSTDDESREVIVHVFVANLYVPSDA